MRKTMRKLLNGIRNLISLKVNLNVRTTLMKLKVVNFMVKLQINANLGMAISLWLVPMIRPYVLYLNLLTIAEIVLIPINGDVMMGGALTHPGSMMESLTVLTGVMRIQVHLCLQLCVQDLFQFAFLGFLERFEFFTSMLVQSKCCFVFRARSFLSARHVITLVNR